MPIPSWERIDLRGREVIRLALGDMKMGMYQKGGGWVPYPDVPGKALPLNEAKALCLDRLEKRIRDALAVVEILREEL